MTRNRPGSPARAIVEQFSNYSKELEVLCGCIFVLLLRANSLCDFLSLERSRERTGPAKLCAVARPVPDLGHLSTTLDQISTTRCG
jgi:hypothetical protein